jgi:hypothetical protein
LFRCCTHRLAFLAFGPLMTSLMLHGYLDFFRANNAPTNFTSALVVWLLWNVSLFNALVHAVKL